MDSTIAGLFEDFAAARSAMKELVSRGISPDHVSLLASDPEGQYARSFETDKYGSAFEGAASGAAAGGAVPLAVGLASFLIPGIGPVIGLGILGLGIAGAGVGAAIGGIIGALGNVGVPPERAARYEEGIRRGGALVVVHDEEDAARLEEARSVLEAHSAIDLDEDAERWDRREPRNVGPEGEPPAEAEERELPRSAA